MFEDPTIDAVVIVTPTKTACSVNYSSSQKVKKHIFVDKPLTETLGEAEMVIREIQENNVYCQVGFMRRFDPAYAEAKKTH
ncbi:hypothetical protein GCM10020331_097390 [Ectobacillus funiculus]